MRGRSLWWLMVAVAFPVSAQNLLQNPNFDLDASGWTVSGSGTATWSANGSPTRGAILLSATSTGPEVSVFQCVAISAPAVIDVGARSFTSSSFGDGSTNEMNVSLFSGTACSGAILGTISVASGTFDPPDNWFNRRALTQPLPAGTQSARVELKANAGTGQMIIYFDTVVFGPVGAWGCVVWATPLTAPRGNVNQPYAQTFIGQGGTAPYTFTLVGSLPDGLTLSATGILSGTPRAAGTFPVDIAVRDVNGCRGERKYVIQIVSVPRRRAVGSH
jgi:hypothetical protein